MSELLVLSVDRALDIMKIVPDPEAKNFTQVLARQTAIAQSMFTTFSRIDQARLRGRVGDRTKEILTAIAEEEARRL